MQSEHTASWVDQSKVYVSLAPFNPKIAAPNTYPNWCVFSSPLPCQSIDYSALTDNMWGDVRGDNSRPDPYAPSQDRGLCSPLLDGAGTQNLVALVALEGR